jgi:hypothetical protein
VTLQQPAAPAYLRRVELASDWAFYRPGASPMAVLLSFPLPGTSDGPRDFHVFLALPDREGEIRVGSDPDGVRGFLIQEVGLLRGKSRITGGRVLVNRPWNDPDVRELELDLRCEDDTLILGTASARPSASEIATFERKRAADIAALGSDSDVAPAGGGSAARPIAASQPGAAESSGSE